MRWNSIIEHMYAQCIDVGAETCMPVYYEQLVLHPEASMKSILKFLDIPFDEAVLHHEQYIGKSIFKLIIVKFFLLCSYFRTLNKKKKSVSK